MDAIRISDGLRVFFKVIPAAHDYERRVHKTLWSPQHRVDPRNHCVPLLDVLWPPNSGEMLLVIPLLRSFEDPEFDTVGEVIDFIDQLFEVRK